MHGLNIERALVNILNHLEKELKMIPQKIADEIAAIKAALASHNDQGAADAQKIADLEAQNAAKDAQIAELNQEVADIEAALAALAPSGGGEVAPPADGSGSGDVTP